MKKSAIRITTSLLALAVMLASCNAEDKAAAPAAAAPATETKTEEPKKEEPAKEEGGEVTKVKVGVLTDPKNPANFQFDTKSFEVPAGAKVMILFQNEKDLLMHNFMIIKPGTLQVVATAADKSAADPKYLQNGCVLAIPEVLFTGKKLLKAGEKELIEFTAPTEPGDYPYVCTFPGHARTMNGIMKVVKK